MVHLLRGLWSSLALSLTAPLPVITKNKQKQLVETTQNKTKIKCYWEASYQEVVNNMVPIHNSIKL